MEKRTLECGGVESLSLSCDVTDGRCDDHHQGCIVTAAAMGVDTVAPPRPLSENKEIISSKLAPSNEGNNNSEGALVSPPRDDNHNAQLPTVRATPLTPSDALKSFGDRLTEWERNEIRKYPELWFLGLEAKKIEAKANLPNNCGFDDENGSYTKQMHDHVAYRYEILEVIGKGSFGQVIRAYDHRCGKQVAIKIIRNKKRFHHQALVEVRVLDHLRLKDKEQAHNVIHMLDYFYFRNHLCISFELMSINLYELIKKNNYQGFSLSLIRRFTRKHLAEGARQLLHKGDRLRQFLLHALPRVHVYTVTLLPEPRGCILAELHTGYPLFPGENESEQLACIMELLGPPPPDLLIHATRKRLFFVTSALADTHVANDGEMMN
ncbi:unnamed protein product [Leptidea sinapis]|uniref:dual-specificity kinase n=1 Tax=Leptidea sinapis TaxID=189913 RepID=A0A5E4R084_9NEOP|nr:unnamed protein product [Leptidea sinapis]